jgi:hypothetical protein
VADEVEDVFGDPVGLFEVQECGPSSKLPPNRFDT